MGSQCAMYLLQCAYCNVLIRVQQLAIAKCGLQLLYLCGQLAELCGLLEKVKSHTYYKGHRFYLEVKSTYQGSKCINSPCMNAIIQQCL